MEQEAEARLFLSSCHKESVPQGAGQAVSSACTDCVRHRGKNPQVPMNNYTKLATFRM